MVPQPVRISAQRKTLEGNPAMELLTTEEVLAILRIARSTFDQWRELGIAPECIKLPNRQLRVRRDDLDSWLVGRVQDKTALG